MCFWACRRVLPSLVAAACLLAGAAGPPHCHYPPPPLISATLLPFPAPPPVPPRRQYNLLSGESVTADLYVSAMPVDIVKKLMPEPWYNMPSGFFSRMDKLVGVPVINIHIWFDRKLTTGGCARGSVGLGVCCVLWVCGPLGRCCCCCCWRRRRRMLWQVLR